METLGGIRLQDLRAIFTDTSFQILDSMSRLETYRWELSNSSFCVGVSIIFDSFIEVEDAGE